MMEQMAGMVSCVMLGLEVWINHFLTFLVILAASGKLVDRFCFAYFFAFELSVRSPCFDISCGGHPVRVH